MLHVQAQNVRTALTGEQRGCTTSLSRECFCGQSLPAMTRDWSKLKHFQIYVEKNVSKTNFAAADVTEQPLALIRHETSPPRKLFPIVLPSYINYLFPSVTWAYLIQTLRFDKFPVKSEMIYSRKDGGPKRKSPNFHLEAENSSPTLNALERIVYQNIVLSH